MMRVKFIDLKPNSQLQAELDEAYVRVMSSGQYIGGSEVESFEREWADYCQSQYCVSTSSGQAALEILLRAHGIGHGDKVIVPSWTAVPTWKAVLNIGAQILPVDVDQKTMLVEVSPSYKWDLAYNGGYFVIPVHLYGYRAYIDYELVIEDACQAHGLKKLGNAAFSFYPTKNLGAYGDGGAIVTNNQDLAQECRDIRDSNRLDPLQAAFLRVKLKYLDEENIIRSTNAELYNSYLTNEVIKPPSWWLYHQYVIRTDKRDELKVFLAKRGIETMIHYPVPPHRQLGFGFDLPVADKLAQTVLSLPVMTSEENIWKVIKAVNEFASQS